MVTPHLPWKFHANRSSRFLVMLLTKKQRNRPKTIPRTLAERGKDRLQGWSVLSASNKRSSTQCEPEDVDRRQWFYKAVARETRWTLHCTCIQGFGCTELITSRRVREQQRPKCCWRWAKPCCISCCHRCCCCRTRDPLITLPATVAFVLTRRECAQQRYVCEYNYISESVREHCRSYMARN